MKTLYVLMVSVLFVSVANAGMLLSVNGQPAPAAIALEMSEVITLDILVEDGQLFAGGDIGIVLNNPQGALDHSSISFITNPPTRQYIMGQGWIWPLPHLSWDAPWSVYESSAQHVYMTGGNNPGTSGNTVGPYTLMDGLVFHLEEWTGVIIELIALCDLVYYTFTGDPPELDGMVAFYSHDDVIDTIHVVPEPATFVLLGLGGLMLRRKRRQ